MSNPRLLKAAIVALLIGGCAVALYAFAPFLFFLSALVGVLGLFAFLVTRFANWFRQQRCGRNIP